MIAGKTLGRHLVAMLAAFLGNAVKPGTDFDALDGIDAHHGVGDLGIQPVIHRLAPTGRHAAGGDGDFCTNGIQRLAQVVHICFQLGHDGGIRRKKGIAVDFVRRHERNLDRSQRAHPATNRDAVTLVEPLAGNRTGCHAHRSLARRGTASAAKVAESVFLRIGVIGMTGAEGLGDIAVILAALVLIADQQADRRASGLALEDAGENLDGIRLTTLRHMTRRSRLAAIKFCLDIGLAQSQARRTTIDDAANRRAMRFAKGCHSQQGAEGIAGHKKEA